jgi:nucleoside-triphosphatase THEP1
MSSLEALETQLAAFQATSQNLRLEPLKSMQDVERFGVPYQTQLVDEMEQQINNPANSSRKFVFTGHTGCGKSTLLRKLNLRLLQTRKYFIVFFSIADTIEQSAVDHVNILFSTALELIEAAERRDVKLKPGIKRELYRWLGKHTSTEAQGIESVLEVSGEVSAKGGIPILMEFLAKVKSSLKINSVIRQEISIEFGKKISELVGQLNLIKTYIEQATGQQVLVIIDDMDKLELSITDTIFGKNVGSLLGPDLRIVYTIPIATLRELSLRRIVESRFKQIHTMPVAKFFGKAEAKQPNRSANPELMGIFRSILDKRLPDNLVDAGIKETMILKSGGVIRELIRIADLCCDKCMQSLSRQIRNTQFDQSAVTIDTAILAEVLTDLQISFAEPLGRKDYKQLKSIYEESEPEDTEDQRFLDLLHGLYVLEYRNATKWYDLHPIVHDLLVQRGDLP